MDALEFTKFFDVPGSTVTLRAKELLAICHHEMVAESNVGRALEALMVAGQNVTDPIYASAPMTAKVTVPALLKTVVANLNSIKSKGAIAHAE